MIEKLLKLAILFVAGMFLTAPEATSNRKRTNDAPVVTPAPVPVPEAGAGVLEIRSEHSVGVAPQGKAPLPTLTDFRGQAGARPAEPVDERPPHAVSAVTTAASRPAAGGFCVGGSCSVAAPRRVVFERPKWPRLFSGRVFGRQR